jgi:hypothetical protein
MPGTHRLQLGALFQAFLDGIDAARRERTAIRQIDQVRRQALDGPQFFLPDLIQTGQGAEKANSIGVAGPPPPKNRRT